MNDAQFFRYLDILLWLKFYFKEKRR